MTHFVLWQRIEGALVFLAGIGLLWWLDSGIAWWLALLVFFAPDLSFLGYLLGPRFGGALYNSVHIYGFGAAMLALGVLASLAVLAGLGALFLAHSGFDRLMGYGLKSRESFSETHMGRIGKAKSGRQTR